MPYTLTLLGSDANFSPSHVEDVYDKAETLSYISTLIKGDPETTDDIIHYRNTHVAVINGPRGLGAEIGDRIARGVLVMLEAICRGESQLCILGHGRGAVEGLLVAHELYRIQGILKNPSVAITEITNSESGHTHTAMNGPHNESYAALKFNDLVEHIGRIKIAMLCIDPVCGAKYSSTPQAVFFLWRDLRFYRIPEIVKEFEEYVYENERTGALKVLIPKTESDSTFYKLQVLPGHYDTGSGNLKDQMRGTNPTDKTTKHIQELLLVKLVDFLNRNKVEMKPNRPEKDPFSHLMSRLFDTPMTEKKLQSIYLELYDKIVENKVGYEHYNKTSYPMLGQEQGLYKQLWKKVDDRIVHYKDNQDTLLSSLFYIAPEAHFLNAEHARIFLNTELNLEEGVALSDTIKHTLNAVIELTNKHKQLVDLNSSANTTEGEDRFKLLLEGLGLLIDDVTRLYLHNEVLNNSDKTYIAVENAFTFYKRYILKEPGNAIAQMVHSNLNTNLEGTLLRKLRNLEDEYQNLAARMESKAFFNVLQDKIHKIAVNLSANNIGKESTDALIINQLNSFLIKSGKLFSVNPRVKDIREFIEQEISLLNVIKVKSDLAVTSKKWMNMLLTEAIEDSYKYDTVTTIKHVIKSYTKLDRFREILPHFKVFNDTLDYDKWQQELLEKRDHMIHTFVQYIIKEKLNMEKEIQPFFTSAPALYKQIEGLAFGFGVDNPLTTELSTAKKHIVALNEKLALFERQILALQKDNEQLTEQLTTMKLEQEVQMYRLNQEKESLEQKLSIIEEQFRHGQDHFKQEKELLTEELINSRLNHHKDLHKLTGKQPKGASKEDRL